MNYRKTPELHKFIVFSLFFITVRLIWKSKGRALKSPVTFCCPRMIDNLGLSHEVASALGITYGFLSVS